MKDSICYLWVFRWEKLILAAIKVINNDLDSFQLLYAMAVVHCVICAPCIIRPNLDLFLDVKCDSNKCLHWLDNYNRYVNNYLNFGVPLAIIIIYLAICVIMKLVSMNNWKSQMLLYQIFHVLFPIIFFNWIYF